MVSLSKTSQDFYALVLVHYYSLKMADLVAHARVPRLMNNNNDERNIK